MASAGALAGEPGERALTFDVRLEPGGQRFTVAPGQTVLDAALAAGLALPYGCRDGGCGTCRARLLSGAVRYTGGLPSALTSAGHAAGQCLPCLAEPEGDLVLEACVLDAPLPTVRVLPVRLARLERAAPSVMRVWLRPPGDGHLAYRAGQYVELLLPGGRCRAYSLACAPQAVAELELHVRHHPGGAFSGRLFGDMRPGQVLRVRGPYGYFTLRDDGARPLLFVTGGTGFAPVKAMLEELMRRGLERETHLYWGVRRPEDLYLGELVREWARVHAHLRFVPVYSDIPAGDAPAGARTGLVHEAVLAELPRLDGFDVYASGPPPLVAAVRERFPPRGADPRRIYSDSFEVARR